MNVSLTITFECASRDDTPMLRGCTECNIKSIDRLQHRTAREEFQRLAADRAGKFWDSVVMMGMTEGSEP